MSTEPGPVRVVLPHIVAAVVEHMNADHADDCLAICRAAGSPETTSARLRSLDDEGMVFEVVGPGGASTTRIPWRRPIRERADIRAQVTEMTIEARAATGPEAAPRGRSGPGGHTAAMVLLALVALVGVRVPSAAAQGTDPTVAPATTTSVDGRSTTDGLRTLSVSQASELDPAGQVVTITGGGYDVAKGVYVALCVIPAPNQPPSPCGGGADTTAGSGTSSWISSDPPSYAAGLTQPYGPGGGFTVTLTVTPVVSGGIDCRATPCAVVTRNDHTRSTDRSQDIFVPISFRPEPAAAPPTVPPTVAPPPTTAPTTVPAPTTTAAPTTSTTTGAADEAAMDPEEGTSTTAPERTDPSVDEETDDVAAVPTAAGGSSGSGGGGVALAVAATAIVAATTGGIVTLVRRRRPTLGTT